MQQTSGKIGLDHVYFIFADNRYEKHFSTSKMKALINFHALIYGKIVIPDSFFMNNAKLIEFLSKQDHLQYLEKGIIVPSIRNNRTLSEIYYALEDNGTIMNQKYAKEEILAFLEKIKINDAIQWDLDQVALNFSTNFFKNIHTTELPDETIEKLREYLLRKNYNLDKLTRVQLLEAEAHLFDPDEDINKAKNYERYIDITYNFNLPNLMQFSATYPDLLHNPSITPEDVFLNKHALRAQQQAIAIEEDIETNLFNEGILASLNVEQISYLREQKEFKSFQRCFKKASTIDDTDMKSHMITLIDMFDRELKTIISPELKNSYMKERRMLSIKNFSKEFFSGEGASLSQELVGISLGLVGDALGAGALGKLFNLSMKPFTKRHEQNLKMIDYEASKIIKQTKTNTSILDTVKEFSISNVKV